MQTADHTPEAASAAPRQAGRLELELWRDGATTRPRLAFASAPLQLSRVRYDAPEAPGAASFTLLHLGGVLAGDRAEMRVSLGAGAQARVHMAAATQVYRMPSGDAAHALALTLGAGAQLEWLAQPLILFGGARFAQRTTITLAPGARLALFDVLAPGRLARGECCAFARYESRLEVCDASGRLLVAERALLEPERDQPPLPADTPVPGSLFLLGDMPDAERLAAALHPADDPRVGVTVLPNAAGVLVRMLGASPSAVHQALARLHAQATAIAGSGGARQV